MGYQDVAIKRPAMTDRKPSASTSRTTSGNGTAGDTSTSTTNTQATTAINTRSTSPYGTRSTSYGAKTNRASCLRWIFCRWDIILTVVKIQASAPQLPLYLSKRKFQSQIWYFGTYVGDMSTVHWTYQWNHNVWWTALDYVGDIPGWNSLHANNLSSPPPFLPYLLWCD